MAKKGSGRRDSKERREREKRREREAKEEEDRNLRKKYGESSKVRRGKVGSGSSSRKRKRLDSESSSGSETVLTTQVWRLTEKLKDMEGSRK